MSLMDRRRELPRCPVSRLAGSRLLSGADCQMHGDPTYLNADEYVCWPSEQHGREGEELIAAADTLFALSDYLVIGYEIPAV
jgi:hypothetical protein